jgi:hypothetical protein
MRCRTVSFASRMPWDSWSFSQASVGPKSAYRSRMIESARSAVAASSRLLLGSARRRDTRPPGQSSRMRHPVAWSCRVRFVIGSETRLQDGSIYTVSTVTRQRATFATAVGDFPRALMRSTNICERTVWLLSHAAEIRAGAPMERRLNKGTLRHDHPYRFVAALPIAGRPELPSYRHWLPNLGRPCPTRTFGRVRE